MSKHFTNFRAPISSRPAPPSFRKTSLRLSRDLLLRFRQSPYRPLYPLVIFLFLLFFLRFRSHSEPFSLPLSPATCLCPPPVTPSHFSESLLSHAHLVARIQSIPGQTLAFRIRELFHGPPALVHFPIQVSTQGASVCLGGKQSRNQEWLLIAGGVKGHVDNRSLVIGAPIHGCGRMDRVRLMPWTAVKPDVLEALRTGGGGDRWGRKGKEGEWWIREGVSVVAACKDRSAMLKKAIDTWKKVRGIDEIVVVDWSSKPTMEMELGEDVLGDERVALVRVEGMPDWVLSRAYNLAIAMGRFSRVLKVDCDTDLHMDFVEAHPLREGVFWGGDWRSVQEGGANDALHVNGLLYALRKDLMNVGGYDERITTYGWDDSDISERLSRRLNFKKIDYTKVRHIPHSATLRVVNQRTFSLLPPENPHAAAVEIQRNRLLLTRFNIPEWRASSARTHWNVDATRAHRAVTGKGPGRAFIVRAANEVTAVTSLVSDADALDVSKRAIRLILHRFGVQLLPKSLTLEFYKGLIAKVAFPERYAEVVFSLRGGCASRLLAYAASNQATTGSRLKNAAIDLADNSYVWPPLPYRGWRLQGVWAYPDAECSCKFSNVFEAQEEEILAAWFDTSNPLPVFKPTHEALPNDNVTAILKSFKRNAVEKVVSADILKWSKDIERHGKHAKPYILLDNLACDVNPTTLSLNHREQIQEQFHRLVPSTEIQEGVIKSLRRMDAIILDSATLGRDMWDKIVGSEYATNIGNVFSGPKLVGMANRWGPTIIPGDQLVHRLERRAASLTVAVRVKDRGVRSPHLLTENQLKELNKTVTAVSKRIQRLFLGCRAPVSSYLEAYPELALVLAGFLSSETCV